MGKQASSQLISPEKFISVRKQAVGVPDILFLDPISREVHFSGKKTVYSLGTNQAPSSKRRHPARFAEEDGNASLDFEEFLDLMCLRSERVLVPGGPHMGWFWSHIGVVGLNP